MLYDYFDRTDDVLIPKSTSFRNIEFLRSFIGLPIETLSCIKIPIIKDNGAEFIKLQYMFNQVTCIESDIELLGLELVDSIQNIDPMFSDLSSLSVILKLPKEIHIKEVSV